MPHEFSGSCRNEPNVPRHACPFFAVTSTLEASVNEYKPSLTEAGVERLTISFKDPQ